MKCQRSTRKAVPLPQKPSTTRNNCSTGRLTERTTVFLARERGAHMPYWWWILPAVAGLAALGLLAGGVGAIAHNRPYRALGEIFTGGALLALAAIILLFGLDIQTYSR